MPLNIFDGSSWNPLKKIQIHDGSSWNESKAAYVWDGSEWKPLLSLLPKNTVLPLLSIQGPSFFYAAQETVQTTSGDWDNAPTLFEYQWQKSPYTPSNYNWTDIFEKTSSTLLLDEDEWDSQQSLKYVGYVVRCKVTATNAAGKNIDPVYTLPSPVIAPANLGEINVNVVSNGIVEFTWQKVKGANDYYIQYQGPGVPFTEVMSMVDNTDASKGVYTTNGTTCKFTIDTGSASGTLGILINPVNTSNASGIRLTGYGKNASVMDLKPTKPSVTANMTSFGWGGRLSWSSSLIQQTGWTVYNNGEFYASSFLSDPAATSVDIMQFGEGGTTYGSFTVTVTGTATRFTETSWSSTPPLTILYPTVLLPVIQTPPTVSINGRVLSSTNGTWSNSDSIYTYNIEWYSNGSPMNFGSASSLDLSSNTNYDNTSITSSVYVMTTDLRTTEKSFSTNSVTMPSLSSNCDSASACNTPACKTCSSTITGTRSISTSLCASGYMNISTCVTPGICDVITTDTGCVPANTTWYCTTSSQGGGVGNCSYTESSTNNSASGTGYNITCRTDTYSSCQSTDPAPTPVWYCTTSSSGAGIGNCSYTTSATNISASGTGYNTTCALNGPSPACQSTAAPTTPADCGGSLPCSSSTCQSCSSSSYTSTRSSSACPSGITNTYVCYTPGTCANIETDTTCVPPAVIWYCTTSVQGAGVGNCGQATSATNDSATGSGYNTTCSQSGYPACQSTAAPGGGGTTNCSTCVSTGSRSCGDRGTQSVCVTPAGCADTYGPCIEPDPIFAPPSFPSKSFSPPFFPPSFFAPPTFKSGKCLAPDALIYTAMGLVPAKYINAGDKIITIDPSVINMQSLSLNKESVALPNEVNFIDSEVLSVTERSSRLIGFNGMDKNYSITQPIFIKSDNGIKYVEAGEINIGDVIISVSPDGNVLDIVVSSIQVDEIESTVYDVRTTPHPWFIVNSALVIA